MSDVDEIIRKRREERGEKKETKKKKKKKKTVSWRRQAKSFASGNKVKRKSTGSLWDLFDAP